MSYAVTSVIQASAPYALLCLAGLCLAATHVAERRRQKAEAGKKESAQSFGIWPDAEDVPPLITRQCAYLLPSATSRRVKLGPARTSSREAGPLFSKISDRKA